MRGQDEDRDRPRLVEPERRPAAVLRPYYPALAADTLEPGPADLPVRGIPAAVRPTDGGVIVGVSDGLTGTHATKWLANGTIVDLGTLPGGGYSEAFAINSSGQVVGFGSTASGAQHAVLWSPTGVITDLGTAAGATSSAAWGINDLGVVVGQSGGPVMWQSNGAIVALASQPGCLCGIVAKGINNAGLIVGVGNTASFELRAVAWLPNGTIVDLGTRPGDNLSQADAVNKAGVVVGRSGYGAPAPPYPGGAGLKQAVSWQ